jgi:hypothetical protein
VIKNGNVAKFLTDIGQNKAFEFSRMQELGVGEEQEEQKASSSYEQKVCFQTNVS